MYSQYGEDDVIIKLLPETGTVLDIGAWVPKTFSNSRLLIERGWGALLVEFSPGPLRALTEEYGAHPKVRIVQAAMAAAGNGSYTKFDVSDDGLSTADPANRAKWDKDGGYFGSLWVAQLTWDHLFLQFGGGFDFVSIDTEGTSVDLAKQLLLTEVLPTVICVEHDNRVVELMSAAHARGYRVVPPPDAQSIGTNLILARE